jgi:hypothetical protein
MPASSASDSWDIPLSKRKDLTALPKAISSRRFEEFLYGLAIQKMIGL